MLPARGSHFTNQLFSSDKKVFKLKCKRRNGGMLATQLVGQNPGDKGSFSFQLLVLGLEHRLQTSRLYFK